MKPALDEILRYPQVYRKFRKAEIANAQGKPARGVSLYLGYVSMVSAGPWAVRPLPLKIAWGLLPAIVGMGVAPRDPIAGAAIGYLWMPPIIGWIWKLRIMSMVRRDASRVEDQQIADELSAMPGSPAEPAYTDPDRLKG